MFQQILLLALTVNYKPFDESTKKYLMNATQYTALVLPFAILINKLLEDFVSEFDDTKGNFEILAEVFIQFLVITFSIFLIHRIITYIPIAFPA